MGRGVSEECGTALVLTGASVLRAEPDVRALAELCVSGRPCNALLIFRNDRDRKGEKMAEKALFLCVCVCMCAHVPVPGENCGTSFFFPPPQCPNKKKTAGCPPSCCSHRSGRLRTHLIGLILKIFFPLCILSIFLPIMLSVITVTSENPRVWPSTDLLQRAAFRSFPSSALFAYGCRACTSSTRSSARGALLVSVCGVQRATAARREQRTEEPRHPPPAFF